MVLDLYGNRIRRLPVEIGQLRALRRLYVDNNALEEMPHEIGNLRNLLRLYVGQNQLTSIPHQVFQLVGLQELDLRNNKLHSLPQHDYELRGLLWLGLEGNPDLRCPSFPPEIVSGRDGRVVADFCRKKSYQDLISGNIGSKLFRRMHFQRAARFCEEVEKSELVADLAEQVESWIDSADKATTLSRYTNSEYRVADGWRCKVTDLSTGVGDDYFMTISDTGIELKEPHLIRDDTVFIYPLQEETDVTQKDETTLLVCLSDYLSIEIDTSPAPGKHHHNPHNHNQNLISRETSDRKLVCTATSLMVQLQYTMSKQFLAYRAKTYLADYAVMTERFERQISTIIGLIQSKTAAMGALLSLSGLVESKLPKGAAFQTHLTTAQQICSGEHFVVVNSGGTESAPPGVGNVINIQAAETACMHIADDGLRQELDSLAEALKFDAQQLTSTVDVMQRTLSLEHRDLLWCIHTDTMAVSTTLVDFLLQVRGVDYRTMHDPIHNKTSAFRTHCRGLAALSCAHRLAAVAWLDLLN